MTHRCGIDQSIHRLITINHRTVRCREGSLSEHNHITQLHQVNNSTVDQQSDQPHNNPLADEEAPATHKYQMECVV